MFLHPSEGAVVGRQRRLSILLLPASRQALHILPVEGPAGALGRAAPLPGPPVCDCGGGAVAAAAERAVGAVVRGDCGLHGGGAGACGADRVQVRRLSANMFSFCLPIRKLRRQLRTALSALWCVAFAVCTQVLMPAALDDFR